MAAAVLLAAHLSCTGLQVSECGDSQVCPRYTLCDPSGTCPVAPGQCARFEDGAPCAASVRSLCLEGECIPSLCGDGVLDPEAGEQCDNGPRNANVPDATCRRDCTPRRCGDGVVDSDEECDGGGANSAVAPDACRPGTCRIPFCGDAIRDSNEANSCFGTEFPYAVGGTPNRLVTTDFNADGLVDVAVVNTGTGDVSVLIGVPGGTFADELRLDGTTDPTGIAAGDITGDDRIDLLVSNEDENTITVFVGDGLGGFAAPVDVAAAGARPSTIALGRLDDDDALDVVVANCGSGNLTIMRGVEAGTPELAGTIAGDPGRCFVTLADVNGDELLDLVTANRNTKVASVRFGEGDFAFAAEERHFDVVDVPVMAAVEDLNNDGLPDILVASARDPELSLIRNIGNGVFAEPETVPTPAPVEWLEVGLLDDDDRLDVALAHISPSDVTRLSILRGIPGGGFVEAGESVTRTAGHTCIALANVDFDGRLDAIVSEPFGRGVVVLRGGDGTFGRAVTYETPGVPEVARIADVDRDGLGDLIVVDGATGDVSLRMGIGSGRLGEPRDIVTGEFARDLVVADVNYDTFVDLLLVNIETSEMVVLFGNDQGTWQVAGRYPLTLPDDASEFSTAVADLDDDGVLDVVIGDSGTPFRIHIRKGAADGSFGEEQLFSGVSIADGGSPNTVELELGDLNGDDILDLTIVGSSTALVVYPGRGDGTFEERTIVTTRDIPDLGGKSVGIGDITGNGLNDIVGISNLGLSVVAQTAAGEFAILFSTALPGTTERLVEVVDVNGDTTPDVVYVERETARAFVLLGTGSNLAPAQRFRTAERPTRLDFGDINADGVADMAVAGDRLTIHVGNGMMSSMP